MSLISIARFGVCEEQEANEALVRWDHWLGACSRPFGSISYGLWWEDQLVAVAVSASTSASVCGGYPRKSVVELARLCADPDHRDLTRVMLRFWRKAAAIDWAKYWPVEAYVSYSDRARHTGDVYRFDGWKKIRDVRGGTAGGSRAGVKRYEAKSVWAYTLTPTVPSPSGSGIVGVSKSHSTAKCRGGWPSSNA
jgi:hypothetical protein